MENTHGLRLRRAEKEDCRFLYELRNEEEVRKNSFQTGIFSYEDHVAWFERKLEEKNTRIYILEQDGERIGQARVDLEGQNGEISYADGHSLPSYDNARIWLKCILDKADPNWLKFNKIPYMAIYSFVLSPLTDEIRLVRNESSGPMFKEVIPESEFAHITQSMKPGEELRYALILANVYKKGLQKLEFTIKKQ